MTSLALAKIISDALLFAALLFLSFKLSRKQPGNSAGLARMKELEQSLKEVVKNADDATRNLSDELLGRKRDLELLLSQTQGIESRISKTEGNLNEALREAEVTERALGSLLQRLKQEVRPIVHAHQSEAHYATPQERMVEAHAHQPVQHNRHYDVPNDSYVSPQRQTQQSIVRPQIPSNIRSSFVEEPTFHYDSMPEPPSFTQLHENQKATRAAFPAPSPSPLSQQVERSVQNPVQAQPAARQRPVHQPVNESLRSVAAAAERTMQATRLEPHLERALAQSEAPRFNSSASNDPRLGVLGALRRTSQVV